MYLCKDGPYPPGHVLKRDLNNIGSRAAVESIQCLTDQSTLDRENVTSVYVTCSHIRPTQDHTRCADNIPINIVADKIRRIRETVMTAIATARQTSNDSDRHSMVRSRCNFVVEIRRHFSYGVTNDLPRRDIISQTNSTYCSEALTVYARWRGDLVCISLVIRTNKMMTRRCLVNSQCFKFILTSLR